MYIVTVPMVGSKYLCNIHVMLSVSLFAEHIYPSSALKGEWCIQTNPTKNKQNRKKYSTKTGV